MQFEPGRKAAWASIVKKFNSQSTTIKVKLVGWPFTEYSNQVLTQVQSGGLTADLITAPPDLASRLLALGAYAPLDDAVSSAGVSPEENLHDFLTKDGQLFGVSATTVSFGLLYNEATFEKANLTPATNVDEWLVQADALTERPDQFGLIQANTMAEQANFWFQLQNWVNAYDGVWAKGSTPMVNSEPVVKTLELYQKMYDTAIPQGSNDAQLMELMGQGRGAQALVVSATANVLKSGNRDVYSALRSVAAPWESGKGASRVHPISVYEGSSNPEAATEFLTWLLAPENMAELMMDSLDVLPPYPEIDDVEAFAQYRNQLPWVEGYMDVEPVTPMDLMGDFITANDEFGNIVLSNFQSSLDGGTPIADAMDNAQDELEQLSERL